MATNSENLASAKRMATVAYALQAAAPFVGVTYLIAAAISYLQRSKVAGSWLESHFQWQINTFWFGLALGVVGLLTLTLGPIGTMLLTGDLMWIVYRVVQGWTRLGREQPVGSPPR